MSLEFVSFFIILLAGLFLSGVFNRLHLPWVAGLIVAGMAVGPFGMSLFEPTETLKFIAEIGLVFLMFMAGLETRFSGIRDGSVRGIIVLALLATTIPFATGFGIAHYFGYDTVTALLLGIVFISSSVAVIIPSLQANGLFAVRAGKTIMGATIIADVLSLLLLSLLLQTVDTTTNLPLPLFYAILFGSLIALRFILPKVHDTLRFLGAKKDVFERELRLIFTIMLGTVVVFELLGLHAIIAGFFAGFVLSDSIQSGLLKEKLHALSYGIFIPTFFVIVGAETNLGVLFGADNSLALVLTVVAALLVSKMASGYIGGRLSGFGGAKSALIGVAVTPQLSTSLAAVFTGFSIGIVDDKLLTAMIILSIVTTLIAPLGIRAFARKMRTHRGFEEI